MAVMNHPTLEELQNYIDHIASEDSRIRLENHLSSCPDCSERCAETAKTKLDYGSMYSALLPEQGHAIRHIGYDELVALLDGQLDKVDEEIIEGHLDLCTECRADAENLRHVKKQIDNTTGMSPARAEPAAVNAGIARWFGNRVALAAAGVCLLFGIGVIVWLIVGRSREVPGSLHDDPARAEPQLKTDDARLASEGREKVPTTPGTSLNDGGQLIALDEQGHISGLERLAPIVRKRVEEALATGTLKATVALKELNRSEDVLLGPSSNTEGFRLISPIGVVIEDARPVLRWQPLRGATSYAVTVTDSDLNEAFSIANLPAPTVQVPKPLRRGTTYSWQVTAIRDGVPITSPTLPAREARFRILDETSFEEVSHLRSSFPDSHLALGVCYSDAGLMTQALREFRALAANNPSSGLARRLLRSAESISESAPSNR